MRSLLLITALLLLALPANATDPVTTAANPVSAAYANEFYARCMSTRDRRMRAASQEDLCSCSAARMMETMSAEEIERAAAPDDTGRAMFTKLMTTVYAPCFSQPVRDQIAAVCMKNDQVTAIGSRMDRAALCGCTAERTGAWYDVQSHNLMLALLADHPELSDPFDPIMENWYLKRASYNSLRTCLLEN